MGSINNMNLLLLVIPSLVGGRILFPFELEELQKRGGLTADAISFSSSDTTTMTIETSTTTRQEDVESTTTTEIKAVPVCPEGEFWCDTPLEYPDQAILRRSANRRRHSKKCLIQNPRKKTLPFPRTRH